MTHDRLRGLLHARPTAAPVVSVSGARDVPFALARGWGRRPVLALVATIGFIAAKQIRLST